MSLLTTSAQLNAIDRHLSANRASHYLLVLIVAAGIAHLATCAAQAQCAARDVLERQLKLKMRPAEASQQLIKSERDVVTWRRVAIGTFADSLKLRNELDRIGCSVGGQAAEVFARPTFLIATRKTNIELALVSPAQLGFTSDTATLADVYTRARNLGFELAAAEVGPQLRIQYFDQPIGEFLIIGMDPIKTWSGEPVILNVANGGAGLILIGQDGRAEAEIPIMSRIIFARSSKPAPSTELTDQAAVLLPD
ncbi:MULTISPECIES: hypothetical protein [Bradyrhizobium]|uniref:Uncharacterized protein n=1 Tax=Bradyrhizobium frederickii TaxID=2560054 RepID=A0A4Y9NQM6_9BRAD|nr:MULTISPECIES: hypothetical protein [Bradyrhizobium]RTE88414.1 hypothetical protein D6B98_35970 [Bradyrhizobium sp. LVM 105]TFV30152.1 hypothetical protein E4K66_36650 [Bradyrhizobium frederickii]TFV70229.1 hypothetical protein E4K64_30705 [Bradyrhizobium frederickii]